MKTDDFKNAFIEVSDHARWRSARKEGTGDCEFCPLIGDYPPSLK